MTFHIDEFSEKIEQLVGICQDEIRFYQDNYFTKRTPEFFCLELNGEAGELANLEKKSWKGKQINSEDFADEAADVFIALMNYSNARKINLGNAIKNKLNVIDKKRIILKDKGEDY